MSFLFLVSFTIVIVVVTCSKYECGDKPADIALVLDSSGSIRPHDFKKQLRFVNDVIELFDISPAHTQFATVSFSNWAYLNFHLDTFDNKDDIQKAIKRITQVKGDTNTAAAIRYMNDVIFTPQNGAREGVPYIAIVLTDGNSNEPGETAREAARARERGIHVFAIGVGSDVSRKELRAIASRPHSDHVFKVEDYTALRRIKNKLTIKTCQVTDPPIIPRPTDMLVDQACGGASLADVVFAAPPAASPIDSQRALTFFRDLATGFDIGADRVQIGIVPKDCKEIPDLNTHQFTDKDMLLAVLADLQSDQVTTADVFRYMRETSFSVGEGARAKAKRIAVVLIDGEDQDQEAAIREAAKLKSTPRTELFVVGIGKHLRPSYLQAIATAPAQQHLYHVHDYNDLQQIVVRVQNAICPVPGL